MTTQYQAGKPHRGVYHAYIRGSTDKQDIARQQHIIRKYLNGGKHEVKWYIDEGFSGDLPPEQREGLNQCMRDAETNRRKGGKGNIIISDFSRFSRRKWHSYKFFEEKLKKNKCKLIICERPDWSLLNPEQLIPILEQEAMMAQHGREDISRKTKQALGAINSEINSKGFHTTKDGKIVKKLGVHSNMDYAREKASEKVSLTADAFAEYVYRDISYRVRDGYTYKDIAEEFNERGIPTRRGGDWYASTISNIIKRVERSK